MDALSAEALASLKGKAANYHCVSRIVNRDFVLKREEKEHFVKLMRTYEKFCQVRVQTFCVMSNHFHLLLEIPAAPEDGGASWSDEKLLEHLGGLYSEAQVREIAWQLKHFRGQDDTVGAEALRKKYFVRMWDLSAYMKVLKQRFTQWFNRKHGRRGVLWEGRYKSSLVEGGHAAQKVAAYIDLNPVRAGMVKDPKDYRWCGYGEAVAGKSAARRGLQFVMFEELATRTSEERAAREVSSWREVVRQYRVVLFEDGEERGRDRTKNRQGISKKRVEQVLASGGRLSEAELIRCRVRYFLDGVVVGSESFVNAAFELSRGYFGATRASGARKMRRIRSEIRTLRDLQKDAVSL